MVFYRVFNCRDQGRNKVDIWTTKITELPISINTSANIGNHHRLDTFSAETSVQVKLLHYINKLFKTNIFNYFTKPPPVPWNPKTRKDLPPEAEINQLYRQTKKIKLETDKQNKKTNHQNLNTFKLCCLIIIFIVVLSKLLLIV